MVSRKLIDAAAAKMLPFRGTPSSPSLILQTLLGLGATPCVAQEWAGEPRRRAVLEARALERQTRRRRTRPHVACRHILWVAKANGREHVYHATKGWRSYRMSEE